MFRADEMARWEAHSKAVLDRSREATEFYEEARVLPRAEPTPGVMVWIGVVKWISGSDGGTAPCTHSYEVWPLDEPSQPQPYTDIVRRIASERSPQQVFRGNAGKILKAPNGSLCMYTRDALGEVVLLCAFGESPQRRVC